MRLFPLFALLLAALAGGCVVSKTPLAGLGERAAPFASGTSFEIFERADAKAAWKPGEQKAVTFVGGADRIFRVVDAAGRTEDGTYTFHAVAPGRYLVEAQFSAERYGYALLQVRGGEGLASPLHCKDVDPAALQRAGLKMTADDCWLDSMADPAGFLKELAARAPEPRNRYVPVKKP